MKNIFPVALNRILFLFLVTTSLGNLIAQPSDELGYPQQFPAEQWTEVTAETVGLDDSKIQHLFDLSFADNATQGVAFFKNGLLVKERYAEGYDKNSHGTSWSMA